MQTLWSSHAAAHALADDYVHFHDYVYSSDEDRHGAGSLFPAQKLKRKIRYEDQKSQSQNDPMKDHHLGEIYRHSHYLLRCR